MYGGPHALQGYLARKNPPHSRTLLWACAQGPKVGAPAERSTRGEQRPYHKTWLFIKVLRNLPVSGIWSRAHGYP